MNILQRSSNYEINIEKKIVMMNEQRVNLYLHCQSHEHLYSPTKLMLIPHLTIGP